MLLNLSLLGTLGLASIAAAKTITVEVGATGLTFSPSSITAEVGDEVAFTVNVGHSVVEGNGFANPCVFKPGGFFSGFGPKETFTIAVTNTSPIWFYCSTPSHCQAGMVGVINPPAGPNTLDAYATAAGKTSGSTDPGTKSGGITPGSSGSSSSSSSASSSAPESSASSSSAPSSESPSPPESSSSPATEATTTPTAGTNATATHTVSPPPVQQTGAASAFAAETVMVNAFVGLVAVVAGWAGFF